MYKKILLFSVMFCFITVLHAQSDKKNPTFVITSSQKGLSNWKDVKLVDTKTGELLQTIYAPGQEIAILNARTGKPVQKRDDAVKAELSNARQVYVIDKDNKAQLVSSNEDLEKLKTQGSRIFVVSRNYNENTKPLYDKPFSTNSAALAFDKKHNRLYYTPMGINQLRYIDLKSKTPAIYYFEDEAFGAVQGQWDVSNQITRMVIASDGNGYALSNNANHLIRFTTGKKPEITDLGAITDADGNGDYSIHRGMGGDMIADKEGNLYLITAYKNIFKINIESRVSEYKGHIKGIPEKYQTNGAAVEEGSKIIVSSATSTEAYYRVDLNTLEAEKVFGSGEFYNASDLANGNLAFDKKKNDKITEVKIAPENEIVKQNTEEEEKSKNDITVYPNPVTNGVVKLNFANQPAGTYEVQLLDLNGKLIASKKIAINNKIQTEEFRLPELIANGIYIIKITGQINSNSIIKKIVVQ